MDDIALYSGGCAANTSAVSANLGIKVGVVGKVGKDPFEKFIINDLMKKDYYND